MAVFQDKAAMWAINRSFMIFYHMDLVSFRIKLLVVVLVVVIHVYQRGVEVLNCFSKALKHS